MIERHRRERGELPWDEAIQASLLVGLCSTKG